MSICQPIERRLAKTRVPRAALSGDLDEAQSHQLTDCRRNRIMVNAELDEVLIRAGELSILAGPAPVLIQFDFEPFEDQLGGKAQDTAGRAFDHLD